MYFEEVDSLVLPDTPTAQAPRSSNGANSLTRLPVKINRLAQEVAPFKLPDETTPVLTGLLVPALESASPTAAADAHAKWPPLGVPLTPTTTPGRSSPGGSPGYRLGSPALSIGCHSSEGTSSQLTSPIFRGGVQSPESQEAALKQAQSLLARMLTPPRRPGKASRGRSEPPRSATPAPFVDCADMAAGCGAVVTESRPRRRCLSCDTEEEPREAKTPQLKPLNGRMPQFPPAELNSIEQVHMRRKNRFPG